jgi:hypothetical protein
LKIAVISPNTGLAETLRLSFHFVLAPKIVNDRALQYKYADMARNGDFVIIDNGAPEGESLSASAYIEVANNVGADEVILPDVLRDAEATLRASFNKDLLNVFPACSRMIVPQGEDWADWDACLEVMVEKIPARTIGIPKWLNELPGGRRRALEKIWQMGLHSRYNIHLLGVARPLFDEMGELCVPWVRSMDTALPIALAQQNKLFTPFERVSVDWNADYSTRVAERNAVALINYVATASGRVRVRGIS